MKSLVIYNGPSMIDGKPIICVALAKSGNRKTGDIMQTFIMRKDLHPVEALKSGQDASVCGDCKARPTLGGWCYVRVEQSVAGVWKCFHKQEYKVTNGKNKGKLANYKGYKAAESLEEIRAFGKGRTVRLGTYGDPAAVPNRVWKELTSESKGFNGYTHQFRDNKFKHLARFCMASCDSPEEVHEAESQGFRSFVVTLPDEKPEKSKLKAATCPAESKGVSCADCMGCGGNDGIGTTNRFITAHGVDYKTRRYKAYREESKGVRA